MKICVVGTGYVGLVAGTCFAETGNDVICVDIDEKKIGLLKRGIVPIYEPGLAEMIERNAEQERLYFTTDLVSAVKKSLIVFIAVGTPVGEDGSADLSDVLGATRTIAEAINGYRIVVNKSTVPVGTADRLKREISVLTRFHVDVVSNPEFMKEGAAVEDFMKPNRVIIGVEEPQVAEVMKELYAPFTRTGAPIMVMDQRSAEMTKYAANAMLASRISFMNDMANLCEHVGADIELVRQGISSDRRIGASFLFAGVGYGGSCFPKDIRALIQMAREHSCPLELIGAIEEVNQFQKQIVVDKILRFYSSEIPSRLEQLKLAERRSAGAGPSAGARQSAPDGPAPVNRHCPLPLDMSKVPDMAVRRESDTGSVSASGRESRTRSGVKPLKGKTFAVWGLSFKPQTNDMREAPSQIIIERLLELGAGIRAYDPEAMEEARRIFGERIAYGKNDYQVLQGVDALILVTEWNVFRTPDFTRMKELMKYPVIFDGRNQYNVQEMRELGFLYFGIGRK